MHERERESGCPHHHLRGDQPWPAGLVVVVLDLGELLQSGGHVLTHAALSGVNPVGGKGESKKKFPSGYRKGLIQVENVGKSGAGILECASISFFP